MNRVLEDNAPDLGAGSSFYVTPDRGGGQIFLAGRSAASRSENRAPDRAGLAAAYSGQTSSIQNSWPPTVNPLMGPCRTISPRMLFGV